MRILHVLDHGLPLQSGYTFRTRAILKAEEAKGWTVAAVTGPRHGAAPGPRETVDGLDFFRTIPPPRTPSPIGELREGRRADLVVLDDASPLLAARDARSMLDSFLFAGNTPLVRDVMVGGRWQVRDFHHHDEERIGARYRAVVERLAPATSTVAVARQT